MSPRKAVARTLITLVEELTRWHARGRTSDMLGVDTSNRRLTGAIRKVLAEVDWSRLPPATLRKVLALVVAGVDWRDLAAMDRAATKARKRGIRSQRVERPAVLVNRTPLRPKPKRVTVGVVN